jgi:hypothetical protein
MERILQAILISYQISICSLLGKRTEIFTELVKSTRDWLYPNNVQIVAGIHEALLPDVAAHMHNTSDLT